MSAAFDAIVASPAVLAARARYAAPALAPNADVPLLPLGTREQTFIAARDSFYLASVTSEGWPYVQHRGGAPGFLRMIDDRTLAFAAGADASQQLFVHRTAIIDRVPGRGRAARPGPRAPSAPR